MLLKKIVLLGLAGLTAARPHLEDRANSGKAVSGKTSSTGESGSATCKNTNVISAGATCTRVKFTSTQIEQAVKQAKTMKTKGKTGNGLHFPAKYNPSKEAKAKAASSSKTGKRGLEDQAVQARSPKRGKTSAKSKTSNTKSSSNSNSNSKSPSESTEDKNKKTTAAKDPCDSDSGSTKKVGKGVWMFPILEKGVWKPGVFPELGYIILDSEFNYVKTTEREPGSAEEYDICTETSQSKTGKSNTKTSKGKTT